MKDLEKLRADGWFLKLMADPDRGWRCWIRSSETGKEESFVAEDVPSAVKKFKEITERLDA